MFSCSGCLKLTKRGKLIDKLVTVKELVNCLAGDRKKRRYRCGIVFQWDVFSLLFWVFHGSCGKTCGRGSFKVLG